MSNFASEATSHKIKAAIHNIRNSIYSQTPNFRFPEWMYYHVNKRDDCFISEPDDYYFENNKLEHHIIDCSKITKHCDFTLSANDISNVLDFIIMEFANKYACKKIQPKGIHIEFEDGFNDDFREHGVFVLSWDMFEKFKAIEKGLTSFLRTNSGFILDISTVNLVAKNPGKSKELIGESHSKTERSSGSSVLFGIIASSGSTSKHNSSSKTWSESIPDDYQVVLSNGAIIHVPEYDAREINYALEHYSKKHITWERED